MSNMVPLLCFYATDHFNNNAEGERAALTGYIRVPPGNKILTSIESVQGNLLKKHGTRNTT